MGPVFRNGPAEALQGLVDEVAQLAEAHLLAPCPIRPPEAVLGEAVRLLIPTGSPWKGVSGTDLSGPGLPHEPGVELDLPRVIAGGDLQLLSQEVAPLLRVAASRRCFAPLLEKAGPPSIRFHDLPHT